MSVEWEKDPQFQWVDGDPNINPAQKSELSPRERQAYQDIEDHIKDAELESPLFQAFADAVDLQDALKNYNENDLEK